jgi:hypothetical protein
MQFLAKFGVPMLSFAGACAQGHANCMQFLAKFGVPMLVLGGGGYTMRNVARCWCYETGRLLGEELPDECACLPPSFLRNSAGVLFRRGAARRVRSPPPLVFFKGLVRKFFFGRLLGEGLPVECACPPYCFLGLWGLEGVAEAHHPPSYGELAHWTRVILQGGKLL